MANNQHDAGDNKDRPETKSDRLERKAEDNERKEANNGLPEYTGKVIATRLEKKLSGHSGATGQLADKEGKGLASAKDLLGDNAHGLSKKEKQAALLAQVEKDGYIVGKAKEDQAPKGSAEDTGTVTDYKPKKNNEQFFSLGMNYQEGKQDKQDDRNLGDKLSDFAAAAARRATDPQGWQTWFESQSQKAIGIAEGLNEAKEETKAAVAAGVKALTDGTVTNFLAKPNAINEPLFKTVASVFDAVSTDPNPTNKALEALGNAVIKSSNDYSALPKEEQGKVIGKFTFGMVNPEGSTEGAELALKIADKVATQVDKAVMDTIAVSMKAAEKATGQSPEMMQQAKQRLLDYLNSKGLLGQKLEYAGIPDGYFDGMQPTRNAAKDNYMAMAAKDEGFGSLPEKRSLSASERVPIGEQFIKVLDTEAEKITQSEKNFLAERQIQIKPIHRLTGEYEDLGACYSPADNAIYIPEQVKSLGKWIDNDDVAHRIRHEIGHLFNARANPLRGSLSDEAPFIEAFKRDMSKLSKSDLDDLRLSGRPKGEARDEVFADMYGHVAGARAGTECFGAYSLKLKKAFPNCLKCVEEL